VFPTLFNLPDEDSCPIGGQAPTMLAITGGKGGCGKTTTALGIARALLERGVDPLVVDADTDCPDVHLLADVDREPTWDALGDVAVLERVCRRAASLGGVAVLPAGKEESCAQALTRAKRWHGPVLVDCPAGAGPDAATPLRVTDRSLLASVAEPESLEDTAKSAAVARRLGATPAAAVLRSEEPPERLPFECQPVIRIPRVAVGAASGRAVESVLSHPGVAAAYHRVSRVLW
jgi:septum site-determining protein MinD